MREKKWLMDLLDEAVPRKASIYTCFFVYIQVLSLYWHNGKGARNGDGIESSKHDTKKFERNILL